MRASFAASASLCALLAAASPVDVAKRAGYAIKETHFVPKACVT